ncbi:hypothetical protein LTR94_035701, partial [Friedmanniomyces endolithicus]
PRQRLHQPERQHRRSGLLDRATGGADQRRWFESEPSGQGRRDRERQAGHGRDQRDRPDLQGAVHLEDVAGPDQGLRPQPLEHGRRLGGARR